MKKISVVLASLLMAACASAPKTNSTQPQPVASAPVAETTHALTAEELEARRLAAEKAQIEALQKQSVYFDFDKFVVKPEFQGTVQQQADFIKAHGNDVVTLQGNADERGSDEYNLALGDKRATAVKKSLVVLGVADAALKTVSFGEEKPRLTCHEEKCWKENRRVDFSHNIH